MGQPIPRVDARLKVTGAARYPSDEPLANPAFACLATSSIARGAVRDINLDSARAVSGVLDILTFRNANQVKPLKTFSEGGQAASSIVPLSSTKIWHDGQIVALVVAETFEAATEAADRVLIQYDEEGPSATLDSAGAETRPVAEVDKSHVDPTFRDAASAFAAAPVKIDAEYSTPPQHHNPMELFTTTCVWSEGHLTVHEPSQFVYGMKYGLAEQLGVEPENIRVVSRYLGGAFGSKGSVTARTALVALAAKRLGRPVKLVATRAQGFTIATYRAETRHHVKLGADQTGKLLAYVHDGWELSSRPDNYNVAGTSSTAVMYDYGAIATRVNVVNADRNTPGFMRSPPEVPYMYALESGMDELAYALKMDPVELRRRNDTMKDPASSRPYSSRSLMRCFDEAAEAFGWKGRNPQPGSMRDGDWLVGWGCATATYPTQIMAAAVRVRLSPDGSVRVQIAAHDVGTGAYTVVGQAAADQLGVPVDMVTVELGDSALPVGPIAGGSNTTASATSAVVKACGAIRAKLFQAAAKSNSDAFGDRPIADFELEGGRIHAGDATMALETAFRQTGQGVLEEYAESVPRGLPQELDRQALFRQRRDNRRTEGREARLRVRRAFRRSARACADPRNPHTAGGRRLRRRPHHESAHRAQPVDGRDHLGLELSPPRGDGA